MDQERNLGVTEARFALTLLTCLLVAIGYVALLRIGGPKETTADAGVDDMAAAPLNPPPPPIIEPQPRVLPLESPKPASRIALPDSPTNPERR